ncbi:MAG: transcriptional repressor [Vampirovibrionia bacterium]
MKKKSGFVETPQRMIILEELSKLKSHPTADQLYELVRKKMPKVSLGTVYRNLEYLSKEGVIQKLESGSGQKRFDYNEKQHYHIRCVECDRIDDLEIPIDKEIEKKIIEATSFKVLSHNLEFTGICPDWLNRKND